MCIKFQTTYPINATPNAIGSTTLSIIISNDILTINQNWPLLAKCVPITLSRLATLINRITATIVIAPAFSAINDDTFWKLNAISSVTVNRPFNLEHSVASDYVLKMNSLKRKVDSAETFLVSSFVTRA